MRSYYLSLAFVALSLDSIQARGGKMGISKSSYEEQAVVESKFIPAPRCAGAAEVGTDMVPTGKMYGGKMSASAGGKMSATGAPGTPGCGKMYGGKMSGTCAPGTTMAAAACDCAPDLESCEAPDKVVNCGDIITEDTTLSTSLGCDLLPGPKSYALIVDGATLKCTGRGNNMIYNTVADTSSSNACLYVRNGGKVEGCTIAWCDTAVIMQGEGDNVLKDVTIFGTNIAIQTGNVLGLRPEPDNGDVGCYTVECSKATGSKEAGIVATHSGTLALHNNKIHNTGGDAIRIEPMVGNTLGLISESSEIFTAQFQNAPAGSFIGDAFHFGTRNNARFGTISSISMYGRNTVVQAGDTFLDQDSVGSDGAIPTIVNWGELKGFDMGRYGLDVLDAPVVFEASSGAQLCHAGISTFKVESAFLNLGTDNIETDDLPPGIEGVVPDSGVCSASTQQALACSAAAAAPAAPGATGKMYGGKMSARRLK